MAANVNSTAMREQASDLSDLGYGHRTIARRLGVDRRTIQCWLSPTERAREVERGKRKRLAAKQRKLDAAGAVRTALREAVCRSMIPRSEICTRVGWSGKETAKLARFIGEEPTGQTMDEETTVAILDAIHLDPVDIGL